MDTSGQPTVIEISRHEHCLDILPVPGILVDWIRKKAVHRVNYLESTSPFLKRFLKRHHSRRMERPRFESGSVDNGLFGHLVGSETRGVR